MKNKKLLLALMVVVLAFGMSGIVWAAEVATDTVGLQVEAIHIIAVTASTENLMIAAADITAGQTPADAVGLLPAYLQYTTITDGAATYEITAQIAGVLPAGTELHLTTTPGTGGSGAGQGTGVSAVTVPTASAVNIVTAIPSCWTGSESEAGTKVDHFLHITAFADLVTTATSDVVISYTIQDTVV